MAKSQQIGKCGEILVMYKLLKKGIESSPLTTDNGIDLVAWIGEKAVTIQVKTIEKPQHGGKNTKPSIGWWVDKGCPAKSYAFVYLDEDKIWLMNKKQLDNLAQQQKTSHYHFFMYLENKRPRRDGKKDSISDFDKFLLENRV